jgi:hypothetical protein
MDELEVCRSYRIGRKMSDNFLIGFKNPFDKIDFIVFTVADN